ncbi:XrtA/PEP-CTERM system exopolysaccharide export protein [Methylomarinum vadi]|uniref:XrtA/PEP-CTERM system exopolysaccharide export protein n=1 Tax=Methylomarinum vadi TaxID=438855 RepID=UPI0004DFCB7A|nr:XrtA/PEP-CTERM system exopolysaccharide export protein [Methylomarinum vadi]
MIIKMFFTLFCLLIVSGCAYPPLDEEMDFPTDYTYVIGPGDSLEIFVWGNPDISRSVTVRPDGKIATPLINDLMAVGKTPNELARDIEKELSKFVRDPQVAVMVGGFNGVHSQQVRVIGQISGGGGGGLGANRYSARSLPYNVDMTLLDLVIQLGGVGQYGDGNRASIIRMVDGEQKQFGVRIDDLLENADLSANVKIMPGDILLVPEAFF